MEYTTQHNGGLKLPNEVFNYAVDSLVNSSFGFDIGSYYADTTGSYTSPQEIEGDLATVCGTTACIAGEMAYNLIPESAHDAYGIVIGWARGKGLDNVTSYLPSITTPGLEPGADDMISSLDLVFLDTRIFRLKGGEEVTKEMAIKLLQELATFKDWTSVYIHLQRLTGRSSAYRSLDDIPGN